MDRTGIQIDRYRVERTLGEGGFGSVYLAQHTVLGTRVALKVLSPQHSTTPEMVQRFLREAQTAAGIGNPHIVAISDAGLTPEGLPFLAMEVLEGEDLEARLRTGGPMPLPEALHVTRQVLIGLDAAHRAGVVHRDMKPANVFLTRGPDGRPFAKVLDFGISKVLDPTRAANLTGAGMTLGTPAYMAPEQLQNTAGVDHRADLYAVTAMLFEMLSGRLPHPAESLSDLLLRVQGRPPDRIEAHLANVPPSLSAFLQRGLANTRDARFSSATEMIAALDQITAQVTHVTMRPTPALGAWPTPAPVPLVAAPRANRGPWIALGLLGLLLPLVCIAAGAATWFLSEGDEPVATPSPPVATPHPPSIAPPSPPTPTPPPADPTPTHDPPAPPVVVPDPAGPPVATAIPEDAEPCAVPVVHEVSCDRAWDELIPRDCQLHRGREMHLVGSYEPMSGPGGTVQVDIARTAAPLVLVLSSYADIEWEIRAAEGVEIAEVWLVGRGDARATGVPAGVQVRRGRGYPIMAWSWDGMTREWSGQATAERAEREIRGAVAGLCRLLQPDALHHQPIRAPVRNLAIARQTSNNLRSWSSRSHSRRSPP